MRSDPVAAIIGTTMQFTGTNLYLPLKLSNDNISVGTNLQSGADVMVTIEYIKVPPYEELIPFFNTLFRRVMNILKMVQINRHFYMVRRRSNLFDGSLQSCPKAS